MAVNKATQLELDLQDTKAQLAKINKLSNEKCQMETEKAQEVYFKRKSHQDEQKRLMEHQPQLVMEVKRAKSPLKKQLKAVKNDTIAYGAKCQHAFGVWHRHSGRNKADLERLKLELGLFQTLIFKKSPCEYNPMFQSRKDV